MAYDVLGDATMVLHFAFLGYVVAGGFLAWRWSRAIWPHLLAAGWGLSTLVFRLHCPLTWLEDWARRSAGGGGLRHGFVDTYLTGIVYPERYTGLLQLLAAAAVTVSWIGAVMHAVGPYGRPRHPGVKADSKPTGGSTGSADLSRGKWWRSIPRFHIHREV